VLVVGLSKNDPSLSGEATFNRFYRTLNRFTSFPVISRDSASVGTIKIFFTNIGVK